MSDNNNSYRIRTNVGEDSVLNVNINQDFNSLEVLSLKLDVDNLYKLHTANYGCVVGRVLANGGYGIPNAKISIFISADEADLEDDILSYLYPYKSVNTKNADRIRYNLLPEDQLSDCHRNVGTFPSKRTVLDDNNILEVYDKYYKFTTRTNEAGDYMIFGVPTGEQTLHVDIDLSDIGILSQRPRDMVYKGYNITQFENANMFKTSTDLDSLAQIISQNQNVNVYPFWGEESEGDIAITRRDIEIQYEFTPTCVFIGSVITDEASNSISKRCIPSERMGKMDRLTTGNGTIEMIRKTPEGNVEELIIQGNTLIDGNGVWCYQIPMNLDYVRTDEYGNVVRTDDTTKGIPTRASVRFRFSLTEFESEGGSTHLSKVLVPNNPKFYSNNERSLNGSPDDSVLDYVFGTDTDDASFKDLFSNNVYSVKSFIPRFQMLNFDRNKRFSGFKAVNNNDNNNPIPYNNIRVNLTFMFVLQCAIFKILLWVTTIYNKFLSAIYRIGGKNAITRWVFSSIRDRIRQAGCVYIGEGYCPEADGWYFAPGCNNSELLKASYEKIAKEAEEDEKSIDYQNKDKGDTGGKTCLTNKIDYFVQCVEINLAMEYEVIQFDFYNDWINGMIYIPRWAADIRKKNSFLFGLIKLRQGVNGCMESGYNALFSRRYTQQCALAYKVSDDATSFINVTTPNGCKNNSKQKCHKAKGRKYIKILSRSGDTKPGGGVVHNEMVLNGKYAYYFRPCEWLSKNRKCNLFATDIILLGSLEENNLHGIPQTFTKLSSTSYQIPDTLASTNLGIDGFIYGNNEEGSICSGGMTDEPIKRLDGGHSGRDWKENVINWSKGKDFYEQNPYGNEDVVTEASGIDWGYHGPGQGDNSISDLYFPGGHFLGISCFNSQTNIKSCVNLSRICEVGTMFSQRMAYIGNTTDELRYNYTVPTGLISGEEINDYGFKNEFATLNYRGLKTVQNNDTLLREYVFETINPVNFNGELSKKIKDSDYNRDYIPGGQPNEFTRTIEENSVDYYRFRLGLPKGYTLDDAKKKYLISNGGTVSLPVYENSFYFYFGLKGGNTAIDKLYKEFYAECPSMSEYGPSVTVVVNKNATLCEDIGEATVKLKNIEKGGIESVSVGRLVGNKIFDIPGGTDVDVTVTGSNITVITKTFSVDTILPDSFSYFSHQIENYTEEVETFDVRSGNGRITFNSPQNLFDDANVAGVIAYTENLKDNSKPYAKIIKNSNYNGTPIDESAYHVITVITSSDITTEEIVGWAGDEDYTTSIMYGCGNVVKEVEVATETMQMPNELDFYFNGSKYASYRRIIKPLIESSSNPEYVRENWWKIAFVDAYNDSTVNGWRTTLKNSEPFKSNLSLYQKAMYDIKRAIFYMVSRSSMLTAYGEIPYDIVGENTPYTLIIENGGAEKVISPDEGNDRLMIVNTSSSSLPDGYELSIDNFVSPTRDISLKYGYYHDYTQNATKPDYKLKILDSKNNEIRFTVPSIYRPFFFRALFFVTNSQTISAEVAVANGICEYSDANSGNILGRKYKISISGYEYEPTDNGMDYNIIPASTNHDLEQYYTTKVVNCSIDCEDRTDFSYSVSVTENGDTGINENELNTLSNSIRVTFVGDYEGAYSSAVFYRSVEKRCKFYAAWDSDVFSGRKYIPHGYETIETNNQNFIGINTIFLNDWLNNEDCVIDGDTIMAGEGATNNPYVYGFYSAGVNTAEGYGSANVRRYSNNELIDIFYTRNSNEIFIVREYTKTEWNNYMAQFASTED